MRTTTREEAQTVDHDGVRLGYRMMGTGPAVVLVQGLGFSGRMWLSLPRRLAEAGYRVVTPDNRGTGASDAPAGPYTMAQLADDLAEVIEHARAAPALVAGISMGGMIVQHLALRHQELVRGLLLAATSCGLPYGRPVPLRSLATMLGAFLTEAPTGELLWHPKTVAERPEEVDRFRRLIAEDQRRLRAVVGQLAAAAGHAAGFQLHRITCPTEVVTGDSDVLIPPANSRILADRIPTARLTVVSQAGHGFPFEHPEVLPELIGVLTRRTGLRRPDLMTA